MKKTSLGILIGLALTFLIAFTSDKTQEVKKSTAEVDQVQGLYIFTDSKPLYEYEYLGSVKNGVRIVGSSQYQPVRDGLIKKIKKEYPQADGAIFHFVNGAADKADAIKFK
jgi:hypothetical protein